MENSKGLAPDTSKLIDLLWTEAHGNLSNVLKNSVKSYKKDDVMKAEAVLLQLKDCCLRKQMDEVRELSQEFFSLIPHKDDLIILDDMRKISQKSDLCQVTF